MILPVRPLDLEALLDASGEDDEEEDEEEDGECVTVEACVARNLEVFELLLATNPDLRVVIDSIRGQCFSDHASTLSVEVEGCE